MLQMRWQSSQLLVIYLQIMRTSREVCHSKWDHLNPLTHLDSNLPTCLTTTLRPIHLTSILCLIHLAMTITHYLILPWCKKIPHFHCSPWPISHLILLLSMFILMVFQLPWSSTTLVLPSPSSLKRAIINYVLDIAFPLEVVHCPQDIYWWVLGNIVVVVEYNNQKVEIPLSGQLACFAPSLRGWLLYLINFLLCLMVN